MPTFDISSRVDAEGLGRARYALVSVIGPDAAQKYKTWAVSVRGFASSEEEIKEMAETLQASCNLFDLHAVDMGVFVPLKYKNKQLQNQQYDDPGLHSIMSSFKKASVAGKLEFEERKKKLLSSETPKDQLVTSLISLEKDIADSLKLQLELKAKIAEMDAADHREKETKEIDAGDDAGPPASPESPGRDEEAAPSTATVSGKAPRVVRKKTPRTLPSPSGSSQAEN